MQEARILIKNPINQRQAWFRLPFYFGQLSRIGLTGNYEENILIEDVEGIVSPFYGACQVKDLEQLNRKVESC